MSWETVRQVIVFAAALYGTLALALFLRQDSLIYYSDEGGREYEATPAQFGMPYEAVALTAADGIRIDAWYVPAEHERGVHCRTCARQ